MTNETPRKTAGPVRPGLAAILVTLAVSLLFLGMIRQFLITLIMAAIFAALTYPLYRWFLHRLGQRKSLASGLTLLSLVLVILTPTVAILISVVNQAQTTARRAIPGVKKILADPTAAANHIPDWLPFRAEAVEALSTLAEKAGKISAELAGFAAKAITSITSSATSVVLAALILLYAMFFFYRNGQEWLGIAKRSMAVVFGGVEKQVVERAFVVSRATLRGAIFIGIIQGTLGGLGLAVAGVPSALFWGSVMAVASLIPIVGTALIWIPAVVYLLVTNETVAAGLLALWCVVVVSNIDSVLRPVLVGPDAGLPDLLVLISTFGGLAMFGVSGLILGPVLAAVALTMMQAMFEGVGAAPVVSPEKSETTNTPAQESSFKNSANS